MKQRNDHKLWIKTERYLMKYCCRKSLEPVQRNWTVCFKKHFNCKLEVHEQNQKAFTGMITQTLENVPKKWDY